MNLRHLRCFIAVAEELHFGRAARRLHIEQSPLSRTIRQMEADLGVPLLNRLPRSVRLTPAGHLGVRKPDGPAQLAVPGSAVHQICG